MLTKKIKIKYIYINFKRQTLIKHIYKLHENVITKPNAKYTNTKIYITHQNEKSKCQYKHICVNNVLNLFFDK